MGSTTLSPAGKIADRENLALHGTDNPGLELDAATDQQREELIRPTPPRRAKPGNPPFPNIPAASASSPRVALLSGDQRVWAERLMAEIENDVAPRAEFASAWLGNICRSARILALNGIPALGNMRRAPRRGRDFLDDGIRKAGYSYINIHFAPRILEPPRPTPPHVPKNVPGNRRIDIEEVRTPRVTGLSSVWRPGRAAINTFSVGDTPARALHTPGFGENIADFERLGPRTGGFVAANQNAGTSKFTAAQHPALLVLPVSQASIGIARSAIRQIRRRYWES